MRWSGSLALMLALSAGVARPAAAQSITNSEIQRLQDTIYDVSRDISQLRSRDQATATQLQAELDDARDEAVYLKVKLRKNETISRSEYADVRDRIDNIRSRARGDSTGGYTPSSGVGIGDDRRSTTPSDTGSGSGVGTVGRSQNANEIPVGTEFDVRLGNVLSSKTAQVEDRFEGTTMVDLRDDRGRALVPSGSVMRGVVSSVNKATRTDRKGSMTVAFDA
jgi:TolA-binding protein